MIRPVRGTHDTFGDEISKFNEISKVVSTNAELKTSKKYRHLYLKLVICCQTSW